MQSNADWSLDELTQHLLTPDHTEPSENCEENQDDYSDGIDDEQEQDVDSNEDHGQEQANSSEIIDTQHAPREQRTRTRIVVPPIRYRSSVV